MSGTLQGRRILVTRSREQGSVLAERLRAVGAEPVLLPVIEIVPPRSWCALDAALASIRSFDWVVFTSANAVGAFRTRSRTLGIAPAAKRVAAIGPGTAAAVREAGLEVDLMPPVAVAESLASALLDAFDGNNTRVLLVRAEEGREMLPELLQAGGAEVTLAAAYRNQMPEDSVASVRAMFAQSALRPDAVTFTSSSTATNLVKLLEVAGVALPSEVLRVSIGPVTSATLREFGIPAHAEARDATVESLVAAVREAFGNDRMAESGSRRSGEWAKADLPLRKG